PPRGSTQACAAEYGCSDDQTSRLWHRAVQDIKAGNSINYNSGRKGKSGRKSHMTKVFRDDFNRSIELIPLEDRTDIRTLAKRSSKNRPTGTLELKAFTVDRDTNRRALCRMVIPRIKAVWPIGKRVVLQHDNAKPHVATDGPEVLAASKTIEDLVDNVDTTVKQLIYPAIDRVFVTIQPELQASMDVNGSNKYMVPHLSNSQIEKRNGLLPRSLPSSALVYVKAKVLKFG
ncbi:hypothetical protein L916_01708, partial [Phytophthora nicotianae]